MCPDDKILSAYLDGETGKAAANSIRNHLDDCTDCREKLNALYELREVLNENDRLEYQTVMDRVERRLELSRAAKSYSPEPFWKKSLALPLPLALALSCLVIALSVLSVIGFSQRSDVRMLRMVLEPSGKTELQVSYPTSQDIETLLNSLERKDAMPDIIELPRNLGNFEFKEPTIMREAELEAINYNRGKR